MSWSKRKMVRSVMATCLLLSAGPAVAGNVIGNGGDVVVCNSDYAVMKGRRAMLLDYYEGAQRWHMTPQLGDEELAIDEKAQMAIDRLQTLDPDRHQRYSEHLANFWANTYVGGNVDLPELPDSGSFVILPGPDCSVKQIAFQIEPELPGDFRYAIRQELWEMLSPDNQTGLILHEIIYREAAENGHQNSRKTRYFNVLLSSDAFANMARTTYAQLLKQTLSLPAQWTVGPWHFDLETIQTDSENRPTTGILLDKLGKIETSDGLSSVSFEAGSKFHFYPNGLVQRIEAKIPLLTAKLCVRMNHCVEVSEILMPNFVEFDLEGHLAEIEVGLLASLWIFDVTGSGGDIKPLQENLEFYPSMVWKGGKASAISNQYFPKTADGQKVKFLGGSEILFYETGFVKRATLAEAQVFKNEHDNYQLYPADAVVCFDINGKAVAACPE